MNQAEPSGGSQLYAIAHRQFRVETTSPVIAAHLDTVFDAFPSPDPAIASDRVYRVETRGNTFVVLGAADDEVFFATAQRAADFIQWHICQDVLGRVGAEFAIHAAGLTFPGSTDRALLLLGPSGAGKSTLSWELLKHGFGYLSDEAIFLSFDDGSICGFPRALGVSPASLANTDEVKSYTPPATLGARVMPGNARAEALILLAGFGDETSLTGVSAAEAIPRILKQVYARGPAEPILEAVLGLVASAKLYELSVHDASQAAEVLSGLSRHSVAA